HRAVGRALRRHVEHVLDAVDFLLDGRRDRIGDHVRWRPRVRGGDDDRRRHHLGILRGGQREVGEAAEDDGDDRQNGSEDRPVDEETGDVHSNYPEGVAPASAAGLAAPSWAEGGVALAWCCASTIRPGRTRCKPLTMTQSSAFSPSRITRSPSIIGPVFTARYCALLSASTTKTNFCD